MKIHEKSSSLTKPTDGQKSSQTIKIKISIPNNTFEMHSVGIFDPGSHLGARAHQRGVQNREKQKIRLDSNWEVGQVPSQVPSEISDFFDLYRIPL